MVYIDLFSAAPDPKAKFSLAYWVSGEVVISDVRTDGTYHVQFEHQSGIHSAFLALWRAEQLRVLGACLIHREAVRSTKPFGQRMDAMTQFLFSLAFNEDYIPLDRS